jgi:predicted DNA binding protein
MAIQQVTMPDGQPGHTTELTFPFGDESCFFVAASRSLDCEVIALSAIQRRGGGFLEYLTVHAPAEEAFALADSHQGIGSIRLVDEFGSGWLVETVLTDRCVAATLAEAHAIVTEAYAKNGSGVARAEATRDADVRPVVEQMREVHPETELESKHDRQGTTPSVLAAGEVADVLLATLTDKQRDALRTAVLSGYLAWPRRSTASECAEALGVSQPTFSQHLYRGLERLLGQPFDEHPEHGESSSLSV